MNEGIYYLRLNGKVEGPYAIGQIYDLWAARRINSQTPFARFEEMDKWQPLSELTLKISAPKPLASKASPPDPIAPAPPRNQPKADINDYVPAMVYPREQPAPIPAASSVELAPKTLLNDFVNFSTASGLCIVCGVILIFVCFLISPLAPDGKDIRPEVLSFKQDGGIVGTGLILMGGLLLIARQITQVVDALKTGAPNKSERKAPLSPPP